MEKKHYGTPATDIVRVQAESPLAAGTTQIGISDEEATEDAGAKYADIFDDDEYDD